MNIIPNPYLIVIQLVPFLLTAVSLYFIIFKPMLAYLDARLSMTDGAKEDAAALLEKVEAQLAEYEARLAEAHAAVRSIRAERRAQAMVGYNGQIDAARKAAEVQINAALSQLEQEQATARTQLKETVDTLAGQISESILQNLAS